MTELQPDLSYSQTTGHLTRAGELVGIGYSGAGPGRDNPAMEAVHNVGPIPKGLYSIGPAFDAPVQGPCVMRLTPVGHDALGRTGFMIHGDNPAHDASTGCVVMGPGARQSIVAHSDRTLEVTE